MSRSPAGAVPVVGRLLVLAKAPVTGRVKTRLAPTFTLSEAAELALAALQDTLDAATTAIDSPLELDLPVELVLVLDGQPAGWVPDGLRVVEQSSGGLDRRLASAFAEGAAPVTNGAEPLPCLLIGMDTPQVSGGLLAAALRDLIVAGGPDANLGLARDGGWWVLGMRRPDPALLLGLPMSTAHTGATTRQQLNDTGWRVHDLPVLTDVDTAPDAALVAEQAPWSRFAMLHRQLVQVAS